MSALRYLAGVTPLTEHSKNLKPLNQVTPSESTQWQWSTKGGGAAFSLQPKYLLGPGWYMIEVTLSGTMARVLCQFSFSFGNGRSEKSSAQIKGTPGKTLKRLVYFPTRPKSIRFTPLEGKADFTVNSLRIVPVSNQFARKRMLSRVLNKELIDNAVTLDDVKLRLNEQALEQQTDFQQILLDSYEETFDTAKYECWIRRYETPVFGDVVKIQQEIDRMTEKPLVSVIMPVYNPEEKYLRQAISSVLRQSYERWQLCIVDDGSTEPHVRTVLEEYSSADERVTVSYSTDNENISLASNKALTAASGDYIAFLDHDDMLADNALYAMVKAVNDNPQGRVFYSDEDKIDASGHRTSPYFKPQWNRDLFYAYNYLCHFTMIRRELLNSIGHFRAGVEGSQDYDLLLRAVKATGFTDIVHVPHVLYHWRMIDGSTALAAGEKSYTTEAGLKALRDHFDSMGMRKVRVSAAERENTYRVIYPIPENPPLVSLLIPTRDMLEVLKPCVESIINKTRYKNYEILILDNQSKKEETFDWFRFIQQHPRVRVLQYDGVFNFSAINNFGVEHAQGEIVGLINNDVEVISTQWLSEMVSHVLRDGIGCVGAKLLYPDETIQHAGVVLGIGGVAGHVFKGIDQHDGGYFSRAQLPQNYSAVTGACMLVSKSLFEQVGGLDEQSFKVAFNDIDFCLKVKEAGYRNLWTPHALLFHHESKSRGYEDTPEKKKRFLSEVASMKLKWSKELQNDPAYSPNLSRKNEGFQIRS